MNKQVVIVGAGIVGVSTAIWLQRYGCQVTLIDRQIARQAASYGNAGILAQCSVIPVTVPGLLRKAPAMLFSPEQPLFLRWPYLLTLLPWLQKYLRHCNQADVERIARALLPIIGNGLHDHQALAKGTLAAPYVQPDDYLFLYENRAAYAKDQFGWSLRRQLGYHWSELAGEELQAYDPLLADDAGERLLVRFDDHGRISSPGSYLRALTEQVVRDGGQLITDEVVDVMIHDQQVQGVHTLEHGVISTDCLAITSGIWSPLLTEKLGINVPVETERGYHLELVEPNAMPRAPVMVSSGKFVMTPMQHDDVRVLRLAGVVEFGGLQAAASDAPLHLLRTKIRQLLPGLRWQDEREWLGHRPAPVDSIPLIGKINPIEGLFTGFGHHHIGLTGGPRSGQLLAQLITGQDTGIDMHPYRPERFYVR